MTNKGGLHFYFLPASFTPPSTMRAYIYDNSDLDQREPHDSGVDATLDDLKAIGVLYWKFDGPDALQQINDLAVERKYKNRDEVKSASLSLYTN
jgi:1,2-dihydroxy-3-keto-5-methylthiopentene dioxygenase